MSNTKINWGVLGTAGILSATAVGMQKAPSCRMYAIAGRNDEKVKQYMEKYGFENGYSGEGSYEKLLADDNIQAVYIPLPNHLHCEWVLKAIEAGKHVLVEKPISTDVELIKKMFAAAKEKGVFLMEAFAYQHSPLMSALCEEIASGIIGDVVHIDTAFLTSEHVVSNIRMRKETFGGSVYDLGVYNTSFIRRIMGKEPVEIKAVAQFTEENIDILTDAIMKFEGGATATMSCGMNLAYEKGYREDRFYIGGTKGAIRSVVFEYNLCGELAYKIATDDEEIIKTVEVPNNYALEVEQLSQCVIGKETPFVTEEFSIGNATMIDNILSEINY